MRIGKIYYLVILGLVLSVFATGCKKATPTVSNTDSKSTTITQSGSSEKEYYKSQIGMWYTVWWQSKDAKTPIQYQTNASHWSEWTRITPARGNYSSGDPDIIKEHMKLFQQYGIDYLILDDTNGHMNDGGSIAYNITQIFKTVKDMGLGNAPKLSVALGGSFLDGNATNQVQSRNLEAGVILKNYIETYPEIYFNWKDKPLLVSYGLPKFFTWTSEKFTVRYATGSTYEAVYSDQGAPATGLWGWVFSGQTENPEVYGVMPGFNKGKIPSKVQGAFTAQIKRQQGEHYMDMWLAAIKANRESIVITSWNDFAEEPAIEAATPKTDAEIDKIVAKAGYPLFDRQERDKLNGTDRHNTWLDYYGEIAPYWYEEITWAYASLKTTLLDGYYYKEEGNDKVFQYKDKQLKEQTEKPHGHPIIRIPAGYFDWFSKK